MHYNPINRAIFPAICSLAFMLIFGSTSTALADLPPTLKTAQIDWVCVTDADLLEAYAPLKAHREKQGLTALVLSLDEVMLWSPAGSDTTTTLRWLSSVAVQQWHARYLLLGGSHALLPSPVHRLDYEYHEYIYPIDSYYSCLDGQWDVDGDGLFAEWEEDAADPTVHIAVGRLPADDLQSVNNAVAKIIAFEERDSNKVDSALFVSSLMAFNDTYEDPYPNFALNYTTDLLNTTITARPSIRASTLFQGPADNTPADDPLNAEALEDSLSARAHDFVFIQLLGAAHAWQLVFPQLVSPADLDNLANSGHSFLLSMISSSVADTRGECLLQYLLTIPDGGAVAAIAPTGMGYLAPIWKFQDRLWPLLVDDNIERLGDAFVGAQNTFVDDIDFNPGYASSYWYQALMGDPATLLRPVDTVAQVPVTAYLTKVRAVPNPFNPTTCIHFEVTGGDGGQQPVRVEIYDLLGRCVATLLDQSLSSGPHSVPWQKGPASGLYFACITVADCHETIKITLLK